MTSVVTRFPIQELKTENGVAEQRRSLSHADVQGLLRSGRVRFVVADVGHSLEWINELDCFQFWKNEVREHLAEPEHSHCLEDFAGQYFYFASEWSDTGLPIILLSKHH